MPTLLPLLMFALALPPGRFQEPAEASARPLGPTPARTAAPPAVAPLPEIRELPVPAPTSVAGAREELGTLLSRDARVSFNSDSARRASVILEDGSDEVEARSVALLTLGCGRREVDLARVESSLEVGTLPERRAAVLALGEFGALGMPALGRALERDTSGLEEVVCLAFYLAERRGASAAGARLQALGEGDGGLARRARSVLAYRAGETPDELSDTLGFYLELRWRAGRAYGFVDGLRGPRAYAAELFHNEEFLDRVVLAGAGELSSHELEVHLSEILTGEERIGALRVAVIAMPDALVRASKDGRFEPSLEAWKALLAEVDQKRTEKHCQDLLKIAYRAAPELESEAGMLLYRSGADLPWSWVSERLEGGTLAERAALMEACGERSEKQRIPELAEFLERSEQLGIDGEAYVALARLGHPPAQTALRELFAGPALPARARTLAALVRVLHDPNLRPYAELVRKRDDLTRSERFDVLVALASHGATVDLKEVRAALAEARGHGTRMACVSALSADPTPENIDALATLFPVEDDLDLDVELAVALMRARHASVHGLLRAALWSNSWNRSVLAGGLLVKERGTRALIDELDLAPRTASERDLRRVGFALGEWGGLGAVEELARTHTESDASLQGALLGALSSRSGEEVIARTRPPVKFDLSALSAKAPEGGGKGKGKSKAGARAGAGKGAAKGKGRRRKL